MGTCFKVEAPHQCNPVTNEGCDTAAGEACDFGINGFQCYPAPNTLGLCEKCGGEDELSCKGGLTCAGGKCARFCCNDSDCGGGFCNTTTGTGVKDLGVCTPRECNSNGDCKDPSKPICNPKLALCTECAVDGDCKDSSKPSCIDGACKALGDCCEPTKDVPGCTDTKIKECVCEEDSYCCDMEWDATCVKEVAEFGCGLCSGQCTKETDCKDASKPICEDNTCIAKCTKNSDCKNPDKSVCIPGSGKCVQCVTHEDCESVSSPVCDTSTNSCVGCKADGDCKDANKPFCNTKSGACVACKANSDCKDVSKPICDTASGSCVQCNTDSDCKDAAKPSCSTGGVCGKAGNCCEVVDGFA
ncbi:MAG: hypothetical protein RMJ98_17385, partial [Myxococcales bacterium]|nr:hypothetical protein [Myxococcales bacterium]